MKKKKYSHRDSTETASPIYCYAIEFDYSGTIFSCRELSRLTHDVGGQIAMYMYKFATSQPE